MDTSAYILARFWLRVDGVIIRVHETRVWARFPPSSPATAAEAAFSDTEPAVDAPSQPPVLREVTRREASWALLGQLGLSQEAGQYTNPDQFAGNIPVISTKYEAIYL